MAVLSPQHQVLLNARVCRVGDITSLPSSLCKRTLPVFLTGVQVGMKMMEEMAKEIVIPDLKGSESLEFLKIDYVKYNFSK